MIAIINSHTHYDHVGGNVDFPTTVDIVAHANTQDNMEKALPPKGAEARVPPDVFKANSGKNMAKRTFTDKMTIGSGADRIDCITSDAATPTATPGRSSRRCA